LDANNRAQKFVSIINSLVATSPATLIHQPQVGKGGGKGSRNVPEAPFSKIRKKVVEQREGKERVRSDQEGKKHDCSRD
jgi:hypothetical protein